MGPEQPSPIMQFIPAILIFLIFYFLVIKPQKDKQKNQDSMVNSLKKNDQIVTAGGIHGTVVIVKEKTVVVRVDDNSRIEFDKEAIATLKSEKSK